jgi:hypothetical protein
MHRAAEGANHRFGSGKELGGSRRTESRAQADERTSARPAHRMIAHKAAAAEARLFES